MAIKTNVMRILDQNKIEYSTYSYKVIKSDHVDGIEVSKQIGKTYEEVFKTLILTSQSKKIYIFVIPVDKNLNLKECSKLANEKGLSMINISDINKVTGYMRGGCSPIGMKKLYKTLVDKSALNHDKIIISAGKIGYQIEINPLDLEKLIGCIFENII
ncbi:MAG: Cys-tRNA(Pro) deacylase [Peptostreptococcaceae bacterium]